MKKVKKGMRVLVTWEDIQAELHTDNEIEPVKAETVGWIDNSSKTWIRLVTSRYYSEQGFDSLADKIVIPKGCILKIEEI